MSGSDSGVDYGDGETQYGYELDSLGQGHRMTGVVSGFEPLELTSAGLGVMLTTGSLLSQFSRTDHTGFHSVVATTADTSLERKDIVFYDASGGTFATLCGTAQSNPAPPSVPDLTRDVLLGVLTRAVNDNAIASGEIADSRTMIAPREATDWVHNTGFLANTVYENEGTRILVVVRCHMKCEAAADTAKVEIRTDVAQPPTTVRGYCFLSTYNATEDVESETTMTVPVQPFHRWTVVPVAGGSAAADCPFIDVYEL